VPSRAEPTSLNVTYETIHRGLVELVPTLTSRTEGQGETEGSPWSDETIA
jgi:hypothetical protein